MPPRTPFEPRLIVFDLDGTLIQDPSVWELVHRRRGTWESHGLPYWQQFCRGEMDYDTFACRDVACWAGLPRAEVAAAIGSVTLAAGMAAMDRYIRVRGLTVAVVSHGLAPAAEHVRRVLSVDHIHANRLVFDDSDCLTGELEIAVPWGTKGEVVRRLQAEAGCTRVETVVVGDSVGDVEMFREAGVSIAVNCRDEELRGLVDHSLTGSDLADVVACIKSGAQPAFS